MKRISLIKLRNKESELYRRVEDLRYVLYLHHHSPLYQLYKMHAELLSDIQSVFIKRKIVPKRLTQLQQRQVSITRLTRQLTILTKLANSPYMVGIHILREMKWNITAFFFWLRALSSGSQNKIIDSKKTFIILGRCLFSKSQGRGVQIALALSKHHHTIYIEPEFRSGYKPGFASLPISSTLSVVQLKKTRKGVTSSFSAVVSEGKHRSGTVHILAFDSLWQPHLSRFRHPVLYDRAHDMHKLSTSKHNYVLAPHKKLGSIVVPNGVDMQAFSDASKTIQTCDVGLCWIKKPVIGYIGEMDERIDEHAISEVAKAFPKATVVLVGNTNYRPVIAVSEQHENIFPVGEQPYKNLSLYLQSFDILILPLKQTRKYPFTHESLPILLSSGKPLVTVATAQVAKSWRNMLYIAQNHVTLISQVKRALAESKKSKKRKLRIAQARKMKWDVRRLLEL